MRFSTLRASPRASSFSKNRDRLLTSEIAPAFLAALLALPQVKRRLSAEHFSVDGTRLKAWASMKSFLAKDGSDAPPAPGRNGERDFRKKKRSNETHASATDKDARLFRKGDGQESRLAYLGHALMENRNGLAVGAQATLATGAAEREAAAALTKDLPEGATLGADKNYDAEVFVEGLKDRKIEPPIAINGSVGKLGGVRKTAVPPEVAASEGYAISMVCRKRIEEIFGWSKIVGGLAQLKVRALAKVQADFTFGLIADNLVRLPKLLRPRGDKTAPTKERSVSRRREITGSDQEKPGQSTQNTPARAHRKKIEPMAPDCGHATSFSAAC